MQTAALRMKERCCFSVYIGYACLFSEDFLKISERGDMLRQSPFFRIGGTPVFNITEDQRLLLNTLFEKMIDEQKGDYSYKDDLIRNYINLILHEAMKLRPSEDFDQQKNAASRITAFAQYVFK